MQHKNSVADSPNGSDHDGDERAVEFFTKLVMGPTEDSPEESDENETIDESEDASETPDTDDLPSAEGDDLESEDETEDDADEEDKSSPTAWREQKVSVEIDGERKEVPLGELVEGHLRFSDYSRKTAQLADERKKFTTDREEVLKERETYGVLLQALETQLRAMEPQEPDWDDLYQRNPHEWVRQRELVRDRRERLAAIQVERERKAELDKIEQKREAIAYARSEREKLNTIMPAWSDEARFQQVFAQISAYGQKVGFSKEEIAGATDHRAIITLHKARLYDELMGRKPAQHQQAKRPPSNAPILKPGSAANVPRARSEQDRMRQRLKQTGDPEAASALFAAMIRKG